MMMKHHALQIMHLFHAFTLDYIECDIEGLWLTISTATKVAGTGVSPKNPKPNPTAEEEDIESKLIGKNVVLSL